MFIFTLIKSAVHELNSFCLAKTIYQTELNTFSPSKTISLRDVCGNDLKQDFTFCVQQQKHIARCVLVFFFCLTLRKDVNIEGGEEQAVRAQQDSSVITATRPDRVGVYCEQSSFLVISLPSRLISSTTSPHAGLKQSFVLDIGHAVEGKGTAQSVPAFMS